MTKFFALPGLRIGYGITSNEEVLSRVENYKEPWTINGYGALAGEIVLEDYIYIEKSREIEELIRDTRAIEASNPAKAISKYRQAIEEIVVLDKSGPVAAAWRRARYPINRLSLLLEKNVR